jgi:hypothetical protein
MKLKAFISCIVITAVSVGFSCLVFGQMQESVSEDMGSSMSAGEENLKEDTTAAPKQLQSGKEMSSKEMENMMSGMNQGMSKMMTAMYGGILDLFAQKDTAAKLAAFTRNYYDELVKQGFKEEEALKIVASTGMPSLSR